MSGVSSIRLDLREDPELARDLELIRKHYRVGNYTDAVRIAISEMARIIRERSQDVTPVTAAGEVEG